MTESFAYQKETEDQNGLSMVVSSKKVAAVDTPKSSLNRRHPILLRYRIRIKEASNKRKNMMRLVPFCLGKVVLLLMMMWKDLHAYSIVAPRVNSEWWQMATLVVDCFEEPSSSKTRGWPFTSALYRMASIRDTYRYYDRTARRMRNNKYSILISKEKGVVIGMAEVGVFMASDGNKQPTIGVLCVDTDHQRRGIARDLLTRCEDIIVHQWNETAAFVEVECSNHRALAFFEQAGFQYQETVDVTVRSNARAGVATKPHFRLEKKMSQLEP